MAIGGLASFLIVLVIYAVSFYNGTYDLTRRIKAAHENNVQIYGSVRMKIEQSGLIADRYSDQVVRGIETAIKSRYGGGGAQGAMLWIQEQNPTISQTAYQKIQEIVGSEFSQFAANQTTLIDLGREYESRIGSYPGKLFAGVFGFSYETIKPYMTVISTAEAQRDFSTGTMTAPRTFGK